jgi:gag-polypeptide of LTR copia-type
VAQVYSAIEGMKITFNNLSQINTHINSTWYQSKDPSNSQNSHKSSTVVLNSQKNCIKLLIKATGTYSENYQNQQEKEFQQVVSVQTSAKYQKPKQGKSSYVSVQYQLNTKKGKLPAKTEKKPEIFTSKLRKTRNDRRNFHLSNLKSNNSDITFLRPNIDFNASQKLTNTLLNGKNYIRWAKFARVTLKGKGLLGYVNGSRVRPTE